jgi:hypothetical protein
LIPIEVMKGEPGITFTRPKKIGDALLHPRSVRNSVEPYLFFFFLAFFFAAILFSSHSFKDSRQPCWRSAYSNSCIVTRVILVKRKVSNGREKRRSENRRVSALFSLDWRFRRAWRPSCGAQNCF